MPRRIDSEQEARDWKLFHERHDDRARERLILRYVHLVLTTKIKIARRMVSIEDAEDVLSAGHIALITAVDTFDPTRGVQFISHAVCRIRWAMQEFLRAANPVPRRVFDRRRVLNAAEAALLTRYSPTEITDPMRAAHLELSLDEYYALKAYCDYPKPVSEEVYDVDKEEWFVYQPSIAEPTNLEERVTNKQLLDIMKTCVTWLPARERHVVEWYYWRDVTMKVTAGHMHCSESRVHQMHAAALDHLRVMLNPLGAVL